MCLCICIYMYMCTYIHMYLTLSPLWHSVVSAISAWGKSTLRATGAAPGVLSKRSTKKDRYIYYIHLYMYVLIDRQIEIDIQIYLDRLIDRYRRPCGRLAWVVA